MNSVIGVGRTIEQAIANALEELGATQDEVTIKVISEGGVFKKSKVEVTRDAKQTISFDEYEENDKTEIKKEESIKVINKKGKKAFVEEAVTNVSEENNANSLSLTETKKIIETTLQEILKYSKGENIKIDIAEEDRQILVNILGNKLGSLIGMGGETMFSLENVLNVIASKNGITKRIRLDVGNYKKEKESKLEVLADKAYQIAIKSGSYKFEPMPARERRIIHATLQKKEDIKTYSKGEEPKRYVIVEKK